MIVSPHTDDGELACGGTIARFVENKRDVYYVALSTCEKSVPDKFPSDILKKEVTEATKILGIPRKNLLIYDFEVREFPQFRQQILEEFVQLESKIKPDVVICPSSHDVHQDHITTRNEVLRAFRTHTILGFELPWDNITFDTQAFVSLQEHHIAKKLEALMAYTSQSHRDYLGEEYIRGIAHTRGTQIKAKYAECFEVIRWVIQNV